MRVDISTQGSEAMVRVIHAKTQVKIKADRVFARMKFQ